MTAAAAGHNVVDHNDQLRAMVRSVVQMTGTRQAHLAAMLGMSTKHVSQLMRGRIRMRPDVAAQMLDLMGWELVVAIRPMPDNGT